MFYDDAIFEDKECNKIFYNNFILNDKMDLALNMYKTLLFEITNFIAFKSCKDPKDPDELIKDLYDLWQNLNKL